MTDEVRRLEFHPDGSMQRAGLNQTVRSGTKWSDLRPGEELDLAVTGADRPFGRANVVGVLLFDSLEEVPGTLHSLNNDPSCGLPSGLKRALDRAYPDGHGEDGYVMVFYSVEPIEESEPVEVPSSGGDAAPDPTPIDNEVNGAYEVPGSMPDPSLDRLE